MSPDQFYKAAEVFLAEMKREIENSQLKIEEHWDFDHICFRVETDHEYSDAKKWLSEFATELIESEVGGRPIATFEIERPISFLDRDICLVELPAPKPGKNTPTGFEHFEIVVDQPFKELQSRHPGANWKTKGMAKPYNAELALMLESGSIKFHHYSLKSVVELERQKEIFAAITSSKILEEFADHSPLVVGTLPLGVSTSQSDIDILFQSHDFLDTRKRLEEKFVGNFFDGESCATFSFNFAEQEFEIYLSKTQTTSQRAFRHFQIEERLLKYGGQAYLQEIKGLRAEGLKTEPAFASALALNGDTFLELEKLQRADHSTLRETLAVQR